MFDAIPTLDDPFNTRPNPDNVPDADPDFAAPLPDAGTLLAAVGLPAHAIREVLSFPAHIAAWTVE